MTWIDAHRGAAYVLAIVTIAGMDPTVRGRIDPGTGAWSWTWYCDVGAIGSGNAPDESSAKAAAIAALDEWIAEIVDARRAVVP